MNQITTQPLHLAVILSPADAAGWTLQFQAAPLETRSTPPLAAADAVRQGQLLG